MMILQKKLFGTKHDAALGQVVWCQLHGDFVARQNPDVMHPHFSRYMPQNHVVVFELDAKSRIWQILDNLALHLDNIFL